MATNEEFVEQVVGNAIEHATTSDTSAPPPGTFTNMLEAAPGLPTSLAFTMQRGANTILGGGWGSSTASSATQGALRNNNPFRPRTWNRYGSQSIFFENNRGPTGELSSRRGAGFGRRGNTTAYTPFQMATNAINAAGRRFGGEDLVARGSLSRFTAAARLGHMSDSAYGVARPNVKSFLTGTEVRMPGLLTGDRRAAQQAMYRSMSGRTTGWAGGFIAESIGGITDDMDSLAGRAAKFSGNEFSDRGAALASKWRSETADTGVRAIRTAAREGLEGGGRIAAKTAGSRAVASHVGKKVALGAAKFAASRAAAYAIPYAGQALMVYDIAKMGTMAVGGAIKGSVRLGAEGFKSFQGGLNTGPMDQGFKDNEVTMTSRQRGVMAIQNSRLNARSALGSEAAGMFAHFG